MRTQLLIAFLAATLLPTLARDLAARGVRVRAYDADERQVEDALRAGIVGGRQQVAALSLLWVPSDYVRFLANYGHLWIRDAAVPAGLDQNYDTDAFGVRAQFDF